MRERNKRDNEMKEMNIEFLDINELKPYKNNPRNNDDAVEAVANSIHAFGFKVPIIIDDNNVIVAGHTRLKASKKLGLEKVPCIRASDLSEEQIKAFRLADNKVGELATWNYDMLKTELEEISISMDEFGFGNIGEEEIEINEDGFDFQEAEIPEPKSRKGEIYRLGKHRLMVGDSTNNDDVDKLMNGQIADLVVTDPPYNVDISNAEGMQIENDNLQNEAFQEFLDNAFFNLQRKLKAGGAFYVWYAGMNHIFFETALKRNNLTARQQLIWVKNTFVLGHWDYHWQQEPCLYGWKDGAGHYFTYDRTQSTSIQDNPIEFDELTREEAIKILKKTYSNEVQTTILRENKPVQNNLHPTMKPIKLMGRLIKNSSQTNELVLDLFGGSGSTLIACQELGRVCYMMENDPKYADVIIERWEQFTGEKAEKIGE